ncbi:hypothetical protein F2Q69_00035468 [Brassica cretica]|uniref:Uncharacterized protein n=1 Tax=Brassica cretica TaxID=69181 RepID=A0A8S9SEW9_BRACR|nr:hypothetical protein F2Q69_00035468 [Brassica cretica]
MCRCVRRLAVDEGLTTDLRLKVMLILLKSGESNSREEAVEDQQVSTDTTVMTIETPPNQQTNGWGGWGYRASNSSWVMILIVSQDTTNSIDGVDRILAGCVGWFSSDFVGQCSSLGVDRHQCELLKLK